MTATDYIATLRSRNPSLRYATFIRIRVAELERLVTLAFNAGVTSTKRNADGRNERNADSDVRNDATVERLRTMFGMKKDR